MAPTRAELARMAIEHARRRGWTDGNASVSLIGDAPSDIIAARANGARAIAVHTGISTREELAELEPDLLLEDLRDLRVGMLV
jgi:phosphoglycolate phosphatase-like HAD superfamily hydrolase